MGGWFPAVSLMLMRAESGLRLMARIALLLLVLTAPISLANGAVTITDAIDEGIDCFEVSTQTATYFYDKQGAGFTSMLDRDGIDWLNFHSKGTPGVEQGFSGWYRGIPNMGRGTFGHPGYSGATSITPDEKGVPLPKVTISSSKGAWKVTWEFFPSYALLTVDSVPENYWLLYEGTPGGALDVHDTCRTSGNAFEGCGDAWQRDIQNHTGAAAGAEWIYFADGKLKRSLFFAHNDDDISEHYFTWAGMAIFGFGRQGPSLLTRALGALGISLEKGGLLRRTPAYLIMGFIDSTDFDIVKGHIDQAFIASVTGRTVLPRRKTNRFLVRERAKSSPTPVQLQTRRRPAWSSPGDRCQRRGVSDSLRPQPSTSPCGA
jgi:hypothetical protein